MTRQTRFGSEKGVVPLPGPRFVVHLGQAVFRPECSRMLQAIVFPLIVLAVALVLGLLLIIRAGSPGERMASA